MTEFTNQTRTSDGPNEIGRVEAGSTLGTRGSAKIAGPVGDQAKAFVEGNLTTTGRVGSNVMFNVGGDYTATGLISDKVRFQVDGDLTALLQIGNGADLSAGGNIDLRSDIGSDSIIRAAGDITIYGKLGPRSIIMAEGNVNISGEIGDQTRIFAQGKITTKVKIGVGVQIKSSLNQLPPIPISSNLNHLVTPTKPNPQVPPETEKRESPIDFEKLISAPSEPWISSTEYGSEITKHLSQLDSEMINFLGNQSESTNATDTIKDLKELIAKFRHEDMEQKNLSLTDATHWFEKLEFRVTKLEQAFERVDDVNQNGELTKSYPGSLIFDSLKSSSNEQVQKALSKLQLEEAVFTAHLVSKSLSANEIKHDLTSLNKITTELKDSLGELSEEQSRTLEIWQNHLNHLGTYANNYQQAREAF